MDIVEYLPEASIVFKKPAKSGGTTRRVGTTPDLPAAFRAEMIELAALGIARPYLQKAARSALANRTTIERELIACGLVQENVYYAAIARALDLPDIDVIADGAVADDHSLDSQLLNTGSIRLSHAWRPPLMAIAPE